MGDWTYERRATDSNLTVSTQSGVSGASRDIELGVRNRRDPHPDSNVPGTLNGVAPNDDPDAQNTERWKRAREFKGRQIQMMAFGFVPEISC
jgi:hypothetical protein